MPTSYSSKTLKKRKEKRKKKKGKGKKKTLPDVILNEPLH